MHVLNTRCCRFAFAAAGLVTFAFRTRCMRACAPSVAFTKDSVPLRGMAELRTPHFGYFGTSVVTSDSTVVHHVRGGTIPSYVGTDQRRNFRFRGDTLSMSADEAVGFGMRLYGGGAGACAQSASLQNVDSPQQQTLPCQIRYGPSAKTGSSYSVRYRLTANRANICAAP